MMQNKKIPVMGVLGNLATRRVHYNARTGIYYVPYKGFANDVKPFSTHVQQNASRYLGSNERVWAKRQFRRLFG